MYIILKETKFFQPRRVQNKFQKCFIQIKIYIIFFRNKFYLPINKFINVVKIIKDPKVVKSMRKKSLVFSEDTVNFNHVYMCLCVYIYIYYMLSFLICPDVVYA